MAISFLLNCFLQNFSYKHELSFNNKGKNTTTKNSWLPWTVCLVKGRTNLWLRLTCHRHGGKKKRSVSSKRCYLQILTVTLRCTLHKIRRYRQIGGKVWSVGRLHLFTECDETWSTILTTKDAVLTGHIRKSPNVNGRNCKGAVIKLLSFTSHMLEMKT